ncbi:hypothetical protein H696_02463 [Fonticula alba]|uniref:Autophagy-related protein n=1 Tax=Fonticula alba TaxID=691883 RepID=A0A058ZC52_FONAL|nr:hypothetical protein H696_02463 [Fonticula alba]KCV71526.1 hypothetical protein H696_02463 [Fonticula alba]|eukprot:XP_009494649.1 hypothetical protein H696_02463 [Fonticula alba]
MEGDFIKSVSLETRKKLVSSVRSKHPSHVPVIVERYKGLIFSSPDDRPLFSRSKYIISGQTSFSRFSTMIREPAKPNNPPASSSTLADESKEAYFVSTITSTSNPSASSSASVTVSTADSSAATAASTAAPSATSTTSTDQASAIGPNDAIFWYIRRPGSTFAISAPMNARLADIYKDYANPEDGILYVVYSKENAFG